MSTLCEELVERIRGDTMNLLSDKMTGLMSALPGLWSRLRAELSAFADFLEELARTSPRADER